MIRSLTAAACLFTLAACGLDAQAPDSADSLTSATSRPDVVPVARVSGSTNPLQLLRLEREEPVATARSLVVTPPEPDALWVDVEGDAAWSGLFAKGLIAVPGCGWWPIASADATAAGGQLAFTFTPKQQVQLGAMESTLFFYVDTDADGACDASKGDLVFNAELGTVPLGSAVSVSAAKWQPVSYGCSLFSYLP